MGDSWLASWVTQSCSSWYTSNGKTARCFAIVCSRLSIFSDAIWEKQEKIEETNKRKIRRETNVQRLRFY